MKKRFDGWRNFLTGLGKKGYDKTEHNEFLAEPILQDDILTNIFISGGVGSKIIERPAKDSVRRWFNLEDDPDGKVMKEQARIKLQQNTSEAIKMARLYGGALIVMDIDDGNEIDQPVSENKIKSIKKLRVYDRTRVRITDQTFNNDPNSRFFEEPETFEVYRVNGAPFTVHASRCMIFKGRKIPRPSSGNPGSTDISLEDWYWGISEMQHIYKTLGNFQSSEKGIAYIMQELLISVFKIRNLSDILSGSDEDLVALYNRMDIIQAAKSVANAVFVDAEFEDFERNVANIAGAAPILDRLMMSVAAVSEIPVDLLFGRSPSGLNSTGEFTLRNYYDGVASYQNSNLTFFIMPCLDYIAIYTKTVTDIMPVWLPLYEPTEKEQAEVIKNYAEIDKSYVESGILSPEQVFRMRWRNGKYTTEMNLADDFPINSFTLEEEELPKADSKTTKEIKKRFPEIDR